MLNYTNLKNIDRQPVMLPAPVKVGNKMEIRYNIRPEISYIANYCGLPVILHKLTEKERNYTVSDGLYGLKIAESKAHTIHELDSQLPILIDANMMFFIARMLDKLLHDADQTKYQLRISDYYEACEIVYTLLEKFNSEVKPND